MLNQLNTTTKRELDDKYIDDLELNTKIQEVLNQQFDETLIHASGNNLTINSANLPCENLEMIFTFSQDGTGTPSPTNKREISGLAKLEVVTTQGEETEKATITPESALYIGNVNFDTGKVTITHKATTFDGTEEWTIVSEEDNAKLFCLLPSDAKSGWENKALPSNEFNSVTTNPWNVTNSIWSSYRQAHVNPDETIIPSGFTSDGITEFKTWLTTNNLTCVYELATPLEISLTPTQLELFKGEQTVTCNGTIVSFDYQPNNIMGDIKSYIATQIQ